MMSGDLAQEFRSAAQVFREHAQESVAIAYERCADRVEEALEEQANIHLNLQQAADESGYSPDHLGRLLAEGKIPNAGEPYAPRIRRGDLPRKPGHRVESRTRLDAPVASRSQMARSVVESD